MNASSTPVDRRVEGGDGSLAGAPLPFAVPFFRARFLKTSEKPACSEELESGDDDSPMVM